MRALHKWAQWHGCCDYGLSYVLGSSLLLPLIQIEPSSTALYVWGIVFEQGGEYVALKTIL